MGDNWERFEYRPFRQHREGAAVTDAEKLAAAREFSPGIAEWIDAQVAAGSSTIAILQVLRSVTVLARAGRALKAKS